jgi:VCBS repeat-containing protein
MTVDAHGFRASNSIFDGERLGHQRTAPFNFAETFTRRRGTFLAFGIALSIAWAAECIAIEDSPTVESQVLKGIASSGKSVLEIEVSEPFNDFGIPASADDCDHGCPTSDFCAFPDSSQDHMPLTTISSRGAGFIADYESLCLTAYYATCEEKEDGKTTIGWGHLEDPKDLDGERRFPIGTRINCEQARELWLGDIQYFVDHVHSKWDEKAITITQHQFDALVSWSFQTGGGDSLVWDALNDGDVWLAIYEISQWRDYGKQSYPGVLSRRSDEYELFMGGDATRDFPPEGGSPIDYYAKVENGEGYLLVEHISNAIANGLTAGTLSDADLMLMKNQALAGGRSRTDNEYYEAIARGELVARPNEDNTVIGTDGDDSVDARDGDDTVLYKFPFLEYQRIWKLGSVILVEGPEGVDFWGRIEWLLFHRPSGVFDLLFSTTVLDPYDDVVLQDLSATNNTYHDGLGNVWYTNANSTPAMITTPADLDIQTLELSITPSYSGSWMAENVGAAIPIQTLGAHSAARSLWDAFTALWSVDVVHAAEGLDFAVFMLRDGGTRSIGIQTNTESIDFGDAGSLSLQNLIDGIPPEDGGGTSGASNPRLSVTPRNKTVQPGESVAVPSLFPIYLWTDSDGAFDLTSFAIQDRSVGGGYLEYAGARALEQTIYEQPLSELTSWRFVAADGSAVDEIGFNIIQADGDFSPALSPGARVTTVSANDPDPPTEPPVYADTIDIDNGDDGDEPLESDFAEFYIERRGDLIGDVVLSWRVFGIGNDPASSLDFERDSGRVTIRDGDDHERITIIFNDDSLYEPDEEFKIDFDIVSGNAVFSDDDETATIVNDDEVLPWDTNSDDHADNRSDATFVEGESWAQGFIERLGDIDWFEFDLRGGGRYLIKVYGDNDTSFLDGNRDYNAPALGEAKAYLYRANGSLIAQLDNDTGSVITSSARSKFELELEGQPDQTVYLSVRKMGDNDVGQYFVQAQVRTEPDDLPGDTATHARLSLDEPFLAFHERELDDDWFAVELEQGRTYRFMAFYKDRLELRGSDLYDSGRYFFGWDNPILSIHDAEGQELVSTDPDVQAPSSNLLTFTATADGTHYFSVDAGERGQMYRYYALFQEITDAPDGVPVILQPGPADGVDISFTNGRVPDQTGVDDDFLRANGGAEFALRFDLSGLPATATHADIEVFLSATASSNGTTADLVIDVPASAWNESSTFADLGDLRFHTAISSPVVGEWISIDVTTLYNQWQSGELENNGIVIGDVEFGSRRLTFYSSDYSDNPSLRPRLAVYGREAEATVTGTFLATLSEDDAAVYGDLAIAGAGAPPPTFAGAEASGALGDIVVDASGTQWTYTLNDTAQALDSGDIVVDSLFLVASNGLVQEINIEVQGVDDSPNAIGTTERTLARKIDRVNGSLRLVDPDADDPNPILPSGTSETTLGTLEVFGDGTWTYLADRDERTSDVAAVDRHAIQASDGSTIDFSFTLDPVNFSPQASVDSYTLAEGTELTVDSASGVLANDTDPDGDLLTAVLASDVSHGTLTLRTDGAFQYAPTPLWAGNDSFSYTVSDGIRAHTAMVSLTVNPVSDAARILLAPGLNLFGYMMEVPEAHASCSGLLAALGGADAVAELARIDPATAQLQSCTATGGTISRLSPQKPTSCVRIGTCT